ncbi:SusC/RagA family TonB-linked outer membrane protein [Chryseobacterium gambrini]|uniref:TonB-linked outer membrane protein, SusC/RagA family n=1 Tax=Chryseobacterium gambrini TaxID=373672 RepID=A0A1N7Q0P4_9FLAO|nr:SusC/RagA family TonB-linked outer membrane protein [Chryseobacterium gambrini]SIT16177.1 TonB-linked outer membrane protein, SusC/RagA family [Chryseobacterium gambrini]
MKKRDFSNKKNIPPWVDLFSHRRKLLRNGINSATLFILLASGTALQAQQISLSLQKAPLSKAISEIRKATKYDFVYNEDLLKTVGPITVNLKNASLEETLRTLFANQPIAFEIADGIIILQERKASNTSNSKKKETIKGRIVDEKGNPLAGATIHVKGSNFVTNSDINGNFELPSEYLDEKLVLSYIGFLPIEIDANVNLNVMLQKSLSSLDEAIVIAYGKTTKRYTTGSISKISANQIESRPVNNVLSTLDGLAPGLTVTQSTGVAGGVFKVELRGRTALDRSISDDQPLFIIDGIPQSANNTSLSTIPSAIGNPSLTATQPGGVSPLNALNPQDIESIEILKDADATSIYGSRGANGVILITTKRGKQGKTILNLNAYAGISKVPNPIEMLNTQQYLTLRKKAFELDNVTPDENNAFDLIVWDTTRYTDFSKLFLSNNASRSNIQLSINGGNENTQFLFSGNYAKEKSVFSKDLSYLRGSSMLNVNHSSKDRKFNLLVSVNYSADHNNIISVDQASNLSLPPNIQLYNNDGSLAWDEGGISSGFWNPLSYLNRRYTSKTKSLNTSGQISYKVTSDLTLRSNMGYNSVLFDESSLYPLSAQNPNYTPYRYTDFATNKLSGWIVEPQAEFTRTVGPGKLNVLLGGTFQAKDQNFETINATGYSSDNLMESLQGATSITGKKSASPYRYNAFFGRAQYNILGKYLATVSARRDGSSIFASENRFSNFGAMGLTWIFSEEKLIKNSLGFLDFGKLRTSIGTTGNDKISNYQFLDTWATSPITYSRNSALYPNKLYNPDYKWEKTIKREIGLDLSFLKERIMLTTNYYNNRSSNQLISYKLPSISGFSTIIRNLDALIENQGWEFSLNTINVRNDNWKWESALNFTIPKNKLLSFPNLANSSYNYTFVEGQTLNVGYGYKYLGVNPTTGLYEVEDKNGDKIYDINDYEVFGSLDPKFYGGFSNTLSFKRISLNVLFSFRKHTAKNYKSYLYSNIGTLNNVPSLILGKYWEEEGDIAELQRPSQTTFGSIQTAYSNLFLNSSGAYSDASYIRLKNVVLNYDLTSKSLQNIGISNARIYMQGENLLTFTGYELGDPETQNWLRTPPLRTFTIGMNLTF